MEFMRACCSSGAGNGGNNNQRVHSDGWQCRRGTDNHNFVKNYFFSRIKLNNSVSFPFPDGAGEGQDSAEVHADDEPRVSAGYF